MERGLELIDTPGIEGDLLIPDFHLSQEPSQLQTYLKFSSDPIIKEFVGEQEEERIELLRGVDVSTIYGFMIVQTQEKASRAMATAIQEALRSSTLTQDAWIYVVTNEGDFPKSPYDGFWEKRTDGKIFEERTLLRVNDDEYSEVTGRFNVSARSFAGLDSLLDQVALDAENDMISNRRKRTVAGKDPRSCEQKCIVM